MFLEYVYEFSVSYKTIGKERFAFLQQIENANNF